MKVDRKEYLWIFAIAYIIINSCISIVGLFNDSTSGGDLLVYYVDAVAMRNGANIYNSQEEAVYAKKLGLADIFRDPKEFSSIGCYPPIFTLLFLPFSFLPFITLKFIWFIILHLCFVLSLLFILKSIKYNKDDELLNYTAITFTFFYCAQNFKEYFSSGNITQIVFFLFCLLYYLYINNRVMAVGFILSLLIWIRVFPIVFLIYFVLRKQWKMFLATVVISILILIAGILLLGKKPFTTYFFEVLPRLSQGRSHITLYSSILIPLKKYEIFMHLFLLGSAIFVIFKRNNYLTIFGIEMGYVLMYTAILLINPVLWIYSTVYYILPLLLMLGFIYRLRTEHKMKLYIFYAVLFNLLFIKKYDTPIDCHMNISLLSGMLFCFLFLCWIVWKGEKLSLRKYDFLLIMNMLGIVALFLIYMPSFSKNIVNIKNQMLLKKVKNIEFESIDLFNNVISSQNVQFGLNEENILFPKEADKQGIVCYKYEFNQKDIRDLVFSPDLYVIFLDNYVKIYASKDGNTYDLIFNYTNDKEGFIILKPELSVLKYINDKKEVYIKTELFVYQKTSKTNFDARLRGISFKIIY